METVALPSDTDTVKLPVNTHDVIVHPSGIVIGDIVIVPFFAVVPLIEYEDDDIDGVLVNVAILSPFNKVNCCIGFYSQSIIFFLCSHPNRITINGVCITSISW